MMPTKKIILKRHNSSKAICDDCKRHNSSKAICDDCKRVTRVRNMVRYGERFICGSCKCHLKGTKIQHTLSQTGIDLITLENALNKIYKVHTLYKHKGDKIYVYCRLSLPQALANKYVKLVLVDDMELKNGK